MTKSLSRRALAPLAVAGAIFSAAPVGAQVAGGTTTFETSVTESTTLAIGWSVKNTLMGKNIYNDVGQKIGEVQDLIISPDGKVSYVIVGAGGFLGIGRHDVAIPVTRIKDQAGEFVMAGATREMINGLPHFVYSSDASRRDAFVAAADQDIAKGRAAVASLTQQASAVADDVKARIAADIAALESDLQSAESKLAEMKEAGIARWKQFEADVSAATARLRESTGKATG